jgi:hypothetical protein
LSPPPQTPDGYSEHYESISSLLGLKSGQLEAVFSPHCSAPLLFFPSMCFAVCDGIIIIIIIIIIIVIVDDWLHLDGRISTPVGG